MNANQGITDDHKAAAVIAESVTLLDDKRLAGLQEFHQNQGVRNSMLQEEQKRLVKKYGSDHPLVQEISSRLNMQENFNTSLELEIAKSTITNEPLSDNSWRIHGKVYDTDNQPVKGYAVYLSPRSENGNEKESAAKDTTDESGYYSVTLDEKEVASLEKKPLYLSVSDTTKTTVYNDQEPFFTKKGMIIYWEIILPPS
ncbi:MAG: carboxypeptidase-like regulatory domain-containing protein [Chlorobium sp.]|nr:MAG: carboxypeptidase regulatory-like domain-containing protein [Chlorobium sp.]